MSEDTRPQDGTTPQESPATDSAPAEPKTDEASTPTPGVASEGSDTPPKDEVEELPAGLTGEQVHLILTACQQAVEAYERPRGVEEQRTIVDAHNKLKERYKDHPEVKPVLEKAEEEERQRKIAQGAGSPPEPSESV